MQVNSIILKKMRLEKFYILRLNFCEIGTFTACVLITPLPGHKQRHVWRHGFRFATLHVSDSDVRFCDDPGMRIKKTTKQIL